VAVASAGPYANLHHAPDAATPASHHSVFYRMDALPAAQSSASKHTRRRQSQIAIVKIFFTSAD